MIIMYWSSDGCSSDLRGPARDHGHPVQRAARPYPVAVRTGPAQHRRRIGQRARPRQAGGCVGEHLQLLARLPTVGRDALELVRSEEHTSELQSLMRNSYAVFCLKKNKKLNKPTQPLIDKL